MEKCVSTQHSKIVFLDVEGLERMCNTWFDAELDGLQNTIKRFLEVDFWHRHLVEILKNGTIFVCQTSFYFDSFSSILRSNKNVIYTVL